MEVFKEQINNLIVFWECELEDRKAECDFRTSYIIECEKIVELLKNVLKGSDE